MVLLQVVYGATVVTTAIKNLKHQTEHWSKSPNRTWKVTTLMHYISKQPSHKHAFGFQFNPHMHPCFQFNSHAPVHSVITLFSPPSVWIPSMQSRRKMCSKLNKRSFGNLTAFLLCPNFPGKEPKLTL